MNHRFRTNNMGNRLLKRIWTLFSVLFFAAFFLFFFAGIQTVGHTTLEEQSQSLERAVRRSVVHCYAVEGTYPPSLTYLKEHYGLQYDESLFYIDYITIGSNIMPDITILPKNTES